MSTPIKRIVVLALGACLPALIAGTPQCAVAQIEMSGGYADDLTQSFYMDAISFAGTDSSQSRLDVFVYVGYEGLSFTKRDERYYASYELTASIYDSINALVTEKLWTEEIKDLTFDQSVTAGAYKLSERAFYLAPGRYSVSVLLRDTESKHTQRLTRQLQVSDFFHPRFMLSDIMLVGKITMQGTKRSIVPIISGNVGNVADAFHAFFEIYNREQVDSVRYVATIIDDKGNRRLEQDTVVAIHPGKNEMLMRIDHSQLSLGDYRIYIRTFRPAVREYREEDCLAVTNRAFVLRWQGLPRSVKDINTAIDQLRYIAKDNEYSAMKDAKTTEEKQRLFFQFWKKRDPNPNTPRNEKMEQYYARVEYSNKHFTRYIEGWRTDMGMVYIIFGPPNDVSRHPFEIDSKPYEIWRYYDINYDFVFVDQTGFGDYRLVTPISDVWTRPRD